MSVIYHNPRCSTSRAALALLQEHGHQPEIIEYLKTPLTGPQLQRLISQAGLRVRDAIRTKEALYQELGLDDPACSDAELIAAMVQHPVLLNRPFVTTEKGTRLARPIDVLSDIL